MIINLYTNMLYIGIILLISILSTIFSTAKYILDDVKIFKYISIISFIIFIIALIFLLGTAINLRIEYLKYFFGEI